MRRSLLLLTFVLLGVAVGAQPPVRHATTVSAASTADVATFNAGCYLATPTVCKLRVDAFTIAIPVGARLEAFRLQANGETVYDFSTDVSNPPSGSYTPSRVKLDFAATCGRAYVMSVQIDDTSQADFTTVAQTAEFTCPESTAPPVTVRHLYLPLVMR
jgi:hypothetical protein